MSATPVATPAQSARAAAGFSSRREVPLVPAASIAGRALVTVVAIMTFLASLAAGSAILIAGASQDWQRSVAREMTIQVQPVAGRDIEAEVGKAVDIARNTPGIAEVSPFSKDEAEKLLEPWLGTGLDLHDLPVPRLIVLRIDDKTPPDIAALRKSLQTRVSGVNLDDHRLWVARLATMADTVVVVAAAIFGLVLTAMGLAVAFATRGVMAGNREIIGILHFVGAEDRFIAREFQRHFLRLGLKGGLIGGGCAAAAFLAVGAVSAAMVATPGGDELEALFGSFSLGLKGYMAIAVIAIMIAFATGSMSRIIVFRHLRGLE